MSKLIEKLKEIKKNKNDDCIIQIKVKSDLRDRLKKKLDKENLTYKDMILSAIDIYLKEDL